MNIDISLEQVDKAIRALSRYDIDNFDPGIWYQLRVMEKFRVDWAFNYNEIHNLLCGFEAPWSGDPTFTNRFENRLLLELRNVHRRDLNLDRAPAHWKVQLPILRRRTKEQLTSRADGKELTTANEADSTSNLVSMSAYNQILLDLETRYENVFTFLSSIKYEEELDLDDDDICIFLPYQNGLYGPKSRITAGWATSVIEDCIFNTFYKSKTFTNSLSATDIFVKLTRNK